MTTLKPQALEGYAAAEAGLLAIDCPYMATSSSWAAWLYGFGLGCNHAPIHLLKDVTQSRGYTLRVRLLHDTQLVPFPDASVTRLRSVLR